MKVRNLFLTGIALALLGFVTVGSSSPATAADEVFHWKWQAHQTAGSLPCETIIPRFIKRVDEMSGGRLKISLHYAGELVEFMEVLPALQANMIQIANTGALFWRGSVPMGWLTAGNLPPFITRSGAEFNELYHYRGLDALLKEAWGEHGVHFLGSHNVGDTYFWSKKPINSLDELKGFKVRFFGAMSDTMQHFGASPVMLPHPEVYMAISTGTLDGAGTCWWQYRDLKHYEVCPYFIGPPWQVPQAMELLVSQKAWEALPADLQAIVETAAIVLSKEFADLTRLEEKEMFQKSFEEWGTTYIEWGEEDVDRITKEFSLPYLDKVAAEEGSKDPRVVKGVEIIKQFMQDYGYID